jgi:hypothetical protein
MAAISISSPTRGTRVADQSNVEALAEVLREVLPSFAAVPAGEERHLHSGDDDPWWECYDCIRSLASWLAARGALVISDVVLTEQAVEAGKREFAHVERDYERAEVTIQRDALLTWLSRLARGEVAT